MKYGIVSSTLPYIDAIFAKIDFDLTIIGKIAHG
ncbi:hypothetical protein FHS68_003038 [Dyadobacter arcticus]|uniref:Uncharacterized protein n=1 Tax=Dyadobacter arcticus TaxID=1078754 RepID=A0ABX0US94_9BACT|nr:hypothetical protein [Dyadobacter arcticus]